MRVFKRFLVMAAMLPLVLVGPVQASYPGVDAGGEAWLLQQAQTRAPIAFRVFCIQNPSQCAPAGEAQVDLDGPTFDMLQLVNLRVNGSIRPSREPGDRWQINVAVGDCEDFALTKRAQLIAAGLPVGALRIAVGRTRQGEGHAVLVVRTDKGDFVLDNRFNSVRPLSLARMTWTAMSTSNPLQWTTIRQL